MTPQSAKLNGGEKIPLADSRKLIPKKNQSNQIPLKHAKFHERPGQGIFWTQESDSKTNLLFSLSGWGKTKHPGGSAIRLQHAQMKVISNADCNKKNGRYNPIEPQMLCAANQNAKQSGCHGDSGGPFVCQGSNGLWTLQGSVSWGSPRCDIADANTVFARVAEFRDWINKYVKI